MKNTLLFVGKIPCLAVAPSYSEGISDNGKGIFKSAGKVIGCVTHILIFMWMSLFLIFETLK